MAISIADGFQYLGNKPLDSRIKYATLADLIAVSEANLYDGCEAYVTATKKYYSFDSSNSVDPTLGKWRERTSGGGGGGTSNYEDLANKPAIDGTTLDKNTTAEGLGLAKTEDIPTVPTKVSQLQNDSGFIASESDPTVPSWAKQQNPPTPAIFDGEHAGLVPAPASGDSGKYLNADGTWGTPSGGVSNFADLSDVDLSSLAEGDTVRYNATSEKWENVAKMGSGEMDDVVTPLPSVQNPYPKYSTNEQIVGEWIDGKPLYQKTITLSGDAFPTVTTDGTNVFVETSLSSLGINNVAYGYIEHVTTVMPTNLVIWDGTSNENSARNRIRISMTLSGVPRIAIHSELTAWNGSTTYATIRYTKSTD